MPVPVVYTCKCRSSTPGPKSRPLRQVGLSGCRTALLDLFVGAMSTQIIPASLTRYTSLKSPS